MARTPETTFPPFRPALGALALAAAGVVILLCRSNINVSPDSATYLGVAHNITHGKGITSPFRNSLDPFGARVSDRVPVTLWPPGYPLLLAPLLALGPSGTVAAVILNVIAAVILVLLVGLVVRRSTGSDGWALAAAGVAAVSGNGLVVLGGRALSDLPFATAVAAFVYLGVRLLDDPPAGRGLAVAFVSVAFVAGLLRIAALALVLPALIIGWRSRRALVGGLGAAAAAIAPVFILVAGGRQPAVPHPPFGWVDTFATPGRWFLPPRSPAMLAATLGVVVAAASSAALVIAVRKARPLAVVAAALVVGYFAVLIAARVRSAGIPWDTRILAPVFLIFVIAVTVAAARHRWAQVVLVWLVVAQVVSLVHVISQARVDVGYTASRWRRRVGPDVVRRLQSYSAIATNRPDALWVGTGLSSTRLPDRTGAPAAIEAQLAGLRRSLGAKGAVVDLPDFGLGRRTYMLDAPTTARRLGFRLAWAKDSVRVYVPRHRPRPLTRN